MTDPVLVYKGREIAAYGFGDPHPFGTDRHDVFHRELAEANLGEGAECRTVRGEPQEQIPAFIRERHADVLIMGTIARTGLAGLLIGNTAEQVLEKADCSILTIKPEGFVTPVQVD